MQFAKIYSLPYMSLGFMLVAQANSGITPHLMPLPVFLKSWTIWNPCLIKFTIN